MATKKYFEIGDLVWAKTQSFPFWPARIVKPPTDAKSSAPEMERHYIFFFGIENCTWIQDENIVHHSEEMVQAAAFNEENSNSLELAIKQITEEAPKEAKLLVKEQAAAFNEENSNSLELAIKQITEEAPKEAKLLVKEKESPEVSTSGTKKKTAKVERRKRKTESSGVRKKAANKRISTVTKQDFIEPQLDPIINLWEFNEAVRAKNVIPSNKKIGFIGLGMMGQRLVKNLLTTNHQVTVWNRTLEKCIDFVRAGAALAQSPCDIVRKCDIIFCCVSDSEASKAVVFGHQGILLGLDRSPPGSKGYVEMTTMDPTTSIEIGGVITHKGGRYLEAPINGSWKTAENGNLIILSAGDRQLFRNCKSCFTTFSKISRHLSFDVGCASKMNLINSMLIGTAQAAFAEAMALVRCCNLSQDIYLQILKHGPLNSRFIREKGSALLAGDFSPNISLKYQQKDLHLALSLGNDCGQPMSVTATANQVFQRAKLHDFTDVYADYLSN
ncbi:cytokine-like nuclear factor N-PAC [Argiope bruennichi]|uniref:cytokine-like nuclear factor N-PAC n=1 Tax=Argiope bruennichi TaxID=94029 RepID=UPI0024954C51|nr:cytokine-like nuclear factor N-PAC [Argiope bruennichi]XP_055926165.1 cytokine-like nuclear factor N-PAC [Argiope bruennichi]